MQINVATEFKASDSVIYIYENSEDLEFLQLTDSERSYMDSIDKEEDFKIARINRYPSFFHLVKVTPAELPRHNYQEKLRILGNKLLRMIKAEDPVEVNISPLRDNEDAYYLAEGLALGAYQFLKYFSDRDKRKLKLEQINIAKLDAKRVAELNAVVKGVFLSRDLINEPLSFLTATQLANEAAKAGETSGFDVEVLNKKRIQTLKMGGLLAVNKGSQDPPTFSILKYCPSDAVNKKPLVLVGKGVVYDTGGMSLKPTANSMDSMKSDMSGSAAVIGAMTAIAESKLPVEVIGLIPATDNRPGENAYVPGDIITMYDGSTVEVLNTDAEGRMILADALAYAKKLSPELVIDMATLTGSAAMAVGKFGVVAMGTAEDREFSMLKRSGDEAYERVAEFPFWDEYDQLLESSVADVKNIGGREGGAITAGRFLKRFTDYPWIHIDIAGPAFLSADDHYRLQGGTGVGVRLMYEFAKNMCK